MIAWLQTLPPNFVCTRRDLEWEPVTIFVSRIDDPPPLTNQGLSRVVLELAPRADPPPASTEPASEPVQEGLL